MPALGNIAAMPPRRLDQPFPLYATGSLGVYSDLSGFITGVASNAAGPNANTRVTLHWPRTMQCVGMTWTNLAGVYRFEHLIVGEPYSLFCDDPPGGTLYRPLAHAGVLPST